MLLTVPCKVQPSYEITLYHLINTYSQNRMLPSPHIFSCIQAEKKKKKAYFLLGSHSITMVKRCTS